MTTPRINSPLKESGHTIEEIAGSIMETSPTILTLAPHMGEPCLQIDLEFLLTIAYLDYYYPEIGESIQQFIAKTLTDYRVPDDEDEG